VAMAYELRPQWVVATKPAQFLGDSARDSAPRWEMARQSAARLGFSGRSGIWVSPGRPEA